MGTWGDGPDHNHSPSSSACSPKKHQKTIILGDTTHQGHPKILGERDKSFLVARRLSLDLRSSSAKSLPIRAQFGGLGWFLGGILAILGGFWGGKDSPNWRVCITAKQRGGRGG